MMNVNFYSREPILTSLSGNSTYALEIIGALRRSGAKVTLVVLLGKSVSRRPVLFLKHSPTVVDRFEMPGFVRVGQFLIQINSARPWANAFRGAVRKLLRATGPAAFDWVRSFLHKWLPCLESNKADRSWDISNCSQAELRYVRRTIRPETDAVLVNYFFLAPILRQTECAGKRKLVLMHDLFFRRLESFEKAGFVDHVRKVTREEELAYLGYADCVIAIQNSEASFLRDHIPGAVQVIPHFASRPDFVSRPVKNRCLFVGSDVLPNIAGVQWLLSEVWPLIRAREPSAELHICGAICRRFIETADGIHLRGLVPDLTSEYAEAEVCLIPLLFGSGLKVKLVEALVHGCACVSTPVGVDGVEDLVVGCVLTARAPEEFAQAVLTLLHNPFLRERMSDAASQLSAEQFSRKRCEARLQQALGMNVSPSNRDDAVQDLRYSSEAV